ncbi:MMPL family transporter [Christensenella sp. MSJ-20]|uniref:efflux RND transporter permease subunit n=1 Tax=Christensenella sp. MSJ-20 TaxID=2841518 RepID=UPI001C7448D9|nr:MMPL family transporter [Christensenella sp. MSJ-20]
MENMVKWLLRHRKLVAFAVLILCGAMALLMLQVGVNYDMAKYLPEDSVTAQGVHKLEEEFSFPGTASVMVEDVSISQALDLKKRIQEVEGVSSVLWLDDMADVTKPLSTLGNEVVEPYYKDGAALFTVQFVGDDYSLSSGEALEEIRSIIGEKGAISGTAESNRLNREMVKSEVFTAAAVVVPICVVLLMIAAYSWVEPFLYLLVIGISILVNMGSNLIFGEISYITQSMAALLQLAVSLDYSIFLMHRYLEELDVCKDVDTAIVRATKKAITSISASSLTTIAGFLALVFMQYAIGADIGFVLAKGVLFSLLGCILVMPVILKFASGLINRTRHKPILRTFDGLGRGIMKIRYLVIALALVIAVPVFLAQSNNHFLYGDTSVSSGEGQGGQDAARIEERFDLSQQMLIIVPRGDIAEEIALGEQLSQLPYVGSVQSLTTMVDPTLPREILPAAVLDNFQSESSVRLIVNLNIVEESPEMFAAVEEIKQLCQAHYPDTWNMAGMASSIADIKDTVSRDNLVVNWFSILAVALIILFTFRSVSLPVLLVAVIQLSIWINMSVPYFQGVSLTFIGYLVVSSIQLGATIDYAILMSDRYLEFRRALVPPKEAATSAIKAAGGSILISSFILTVAGMGEYFISSISAVKEIGLLIGRGAFLSGLLVLVLLPPLLALCDKIIHRTTWSLRKKSHGPSQQGEQPAMEKEVESL